MKYLLNNAYILDGSENMEPFVGSVAVENGIISEVIPGYLSSDGITEAYDEIINLEGKYLTPGLINLHVHIPGSGKPLKPGQKPLNVKWLVKLITKYDFVKNTVGLAIYKKYLKVDLMSCQTTIRSVGGIVDLDTMTRELSEQGKIIAPRIIASNMAVATEKGHMVGTVSYPCKTLDYAINKIHELASEHVDLIKIMITGGVIDAEENGLPGVVKMKPEWVKACCDEAHKLGYYVAAHLESPEGFKIAAENGVDTLEHGSPFDNNTAEILKERKAAIICTLSPTIVAASDLDPQITGFDKLYRRNTRMLKSGMIECYQKAISMGIPVGLGTDTGCPFTSHYDFYREMIYFSKLCSVSTKFALYSGTLGNAKIAKIDSITGSIETGKSADMAVVNQNPLDDLSVYREPFMVIGRGKIYRNPKVKKFEHSEEVLDEIMSKM